MAPTVVPCTHAGAEIHGVELRSLSERDLLLIKDQLARHGVVFFREQELTPEEHLQLARLLGPVEVNRFFSHVAGYPEIAEVLKEKDQMHNLGDGFHTDHSYDVEPALGSILVAREVPEHGGDTLFVDMYKAFESLPAELKAQLEGMNAVHSTRHVFGADSNAALLEGGRLGNAGAATQDAVHPVVLTHPDSGRKVLFVNPAFTLHFEGVSAAESRPLLERLYHHAVQPEHLHRFRWSAGSVAFWDNRATWHCALNDYHGHRRLMHRVTVGGGKLSELNSPERLAARGLKVDAAAKYNPGDGLNMALRERALGQPEAQPSKL